MDWSINCKPNGSKWGEARGIKIAKIWVKAEDRLAGYLKDPWTSSKQLKRSRVRKFVYASKIHDSPHLPSPIFNLNCPSSSAGQVVDALKASSQGRKP
jgi:hypothetical protein